MTLNVSIQPSDSNAYFGKGLLRHQDLDIGQLIGQTLGGLGQDVYPSEQWCVGDGDYSILALSFMMLRSMCDLLQDP